jgi:hypothetical protein
MFHSRPPAVPGVTEFGLLAGFVDEYRVVNLPPGFGPKLNVMVADVLHEQMNR